MRGTVVDAEGAPVDAFTLTVYRWGSEPQVHSFERAAGCLEVELAAGRMGIALDAPGFATWFAVVRFNSRGNHDLETVHLHPGRAITGRVTHGKDGSPIAETVIRYAPRELEVLNIDVGAGYPNDWWDTTDEHGRFALGRLPERGVYLNMASARHITRDVGLPAGLDRLDVELGGGAMIEGSLSLADGTVVEGMVRLGLDANGGGVLQQRVASDGRFRFEDLAPGKYNVSARSEAGVVESRSIVLEKDEFASVALLAEPLGRVSGRISGLRESELAVVFIKNDDEWQDHVRHDGSEFANGRFVVNGIPDGDYVVEATGWIQFDSRSISRKAKRKAKVVGGDASVEFDFSGRSRVGGRVLAGSRPVRSVMVRAVPKDPLMPSAADMSDAQGRYEIQGLGDGEYELRAQLGLRGTERTFDLTVASETDFDIRLGPFALTGTVSNENMRFMNYAVQARLISGSDEVVVFRDFIDSRGAYRFDGLEAGRYVVSLAWPRYGTTREINIAGASVENANLRPTPSDTREFGVLDAESGEPLPSASCRVEDGVWAGFRAYFDDEMGELPTTLKDAYLTCSSRGYQPVRIRWDGEPLAVKLVRDAP